MSDVLGRLVASNKPPHSEVAPENWADDAVAGDFARCLLEAYPLKLGFFVAWRSPPGVSVLSTRRPPGHHAIVRSERLDPLLIEYLHVRHRNLPGGIHYLDAPMELDRFVLRTIGEFFVAHREPGPAVAAFQRALSLERPGRRREIPFRDQTLTSVHPILRAATQSMSMAHEVGHILNPREAAAALSDEIDGVSLAGHLDVVLAGGGPRADVDIALRGRVTDTVVPYNLRAEIAADLFALETVCKYLCAAFGCTPEDAVRLCLVAVEAHFAVLACHGVAERAARALRMHPVLDGCFADYVDWVQYAVRARAIVRRAGILWARLEHPGAPLTANLVNPYVPRVDAILEPSCAFLATFRERVLEYSAQLLEEFACPSPRREQLVNQKLDAIRSDAALRYEIFATLAAFGCPGGTDVHAYLSSFVRPLVSSEAPAGHP